MDREKAASWIKENCTGSITEWYNTIEYKLCTMKDGWIAVFEADPNGEYTPIIQAKDLEHARSYCNMREPVTVPVNII